MPETTANMNDHVLSSDTKSKVANFKRRDQQYQEIVDKFFDENSAAMTAIDAAREDRNNALDDAKNSMREDATIAPIEKVKRILFGDFEIQKKYSEWYQPDMFVQMLKDCGKYDDAVTAGIICVTTTVDGDKATNWLQKNGLYDQFKPSLDGKELTPAIKGPKPVLPFGATAK